jgi:soluble lytic murein transglycosylase
MLILVRRIVFLALVLASFVALGLIATPAMAARYAGPDDTYRQAFAALDAGQYERAFAPIGRGSDVVLNTVLLGYAMARPGNDYSFDTLANFVTEHPEWPNLKDILMIAEQKLPAGATPRQVANWFTTYPPLTPAGFYRYVDALDATGQNATAVEAVRSRWARRSFAPDELAAFQARFGHLLTARDHAARLDNLLWSNSVSAARAMYPLVSPGLKALAEARLALANQKPRAETWIAKVPPTLRNDPGLLYERVRLRRKNNLDDSATQLLLHAPERLGRPDLWWDERNIMARRALEKHNFALAYRLVARHGLQPGFDYAQAEFLGGWLALRFLNKPAAAQKHFQALYDNATTPVSRARGAYWLGRAYEAQGNSHEAEQHYESAAAFNTTFYGQLATTRLYAAPVLHAAPEPTIPPAIRNKFFDAINIAAVEHLSQIDQMTRAKSFFKAATEAASQRVEFVLLMELAYQLQRPDWAIQTAKAANQKNMLVEAAAFPVLSLDMPDKPEPALTHALIRQESLFNASAGSGAGAKGLMQLMPATAEEIARKEGIPYHPSRLFDPETNVRLGTAFMKRQIDQFDGSYVLSLAGYNAGPRRAREWVALFGDPRTTAIDPIDWIELIPIYETRNYVQRILENLQYYRARLNGGEAPLQILQDLKR